MTFIWSSSSLRRGEAEARIICMDISDDRGGYEEYSRHGKAVQRPKYAQADAETSAWINSRIHAPVVWQNPPSLQGHQSTRRYADHFPATAASLCQFRRSPRLAGDIQSHNMSTLWDSASIRSPSSFTIRTTSLFLLRLPGATSLSTSSHSRGQAFGIFIVTLLHPAWHTISH